MSKPRAGLSRWIAACALAEALGIAVVSITYAAIDRNLVGPAAPWILLAGGWEGLCLGSAQAYFLRRLRISPAFWIGLTIAGDDRGERRYRRAPNFQAGDAWIEKYARGGDTDQKYYYILHSVTFCRPVYK